MDQHKDVTRRRDGRQEDEKMVETKSLQRTENEQSYVHIGGPRATQRGQRQTDQGNTYTVSGIKAVRIYTWWRIFVSWRWLYRYVLGRGSKVAEEASRTSMVLKHSREVGDKNKDVTTLEWNREGTLLATGKRRCVPTIGGFN